MALRYETCIFIVEDQFPFWVCTFMVDSYHGYTVMWYFNSNDQSRQSTTNWISLVHMKTVHTYLLMQFMLILWPKQLFCGQFVIHFPHSSILIGVWETFTLWNHSIVIFVFVQLQVANLWINCYQLCWSLLRYKLESIENLILSKAKYWKLASLMTVHYSFH